MEFLRSFLGRQFQGETSGSVAKYRLFSQATDLSWENDSKRKSFYFFLGILPIVPLQKISKLLLLITLIRYKQNAPTQVKKEMQRSFSQLHKWRLKLLWSSLHLFLYSAVQIYEIHIFILSHVKKYRISVPYMLGLKNLQYVIQHVGK